MVTLRIYVLRKEVVEKMISVQSHAVEDGLAGAELIPDRIECSGYGQLVEKS